MSKVAPLFAKIRASEMNDWVGGSDPETVGDAVYGILSRYLTLDASSRLLDFGCGVGRVLLSVLKHREVGHITGVDIMPPVIAFCDAQIRPVFPQTSFELMRGNNDHYNQFIAPEGLRRAKSSDQLVQEFGSSFSGAYAISVFTHVESADFQSLLKLLSQLLQPGGECLITAFVLTPYSRRAIATQRCLFPFVKSGYEANDEVFIGNVDDRLGFIAFDMALVQQMVFEADLVLTRFEQGSWTGAGFSSSLQDVIVCRKPLVASGPVQHVPTVARPPR